MGNPWGGDVADGSDDSLADAVAYVCGDLAGIREALGTAGEPLDRLVAAMQSGDDAATPLNELHVALQTAGDALGVYGHSRSPANGLRLAGTTASRPKEALLICPIGRCSRYAWTERATATSVCAVGGGQPLSQMWL